MAKKYKQTIGEFLLNNEVDPRYPDSIDVVRATSPDVKQDALVRLLKAFDTQGIEYTDDTIIDVINANEALATRALHFARVDALRRQKTLSEKTSPQYRRDENSDFLFDEEKEATRDEYMMMEDGQLGGMEEDWGDRLTSLYVQGTPAQREAIRYMVHLQDRHKNGHSVSSNAIRSKLKRLRQASGFRLDMSILKG